MFYETKDNNHNLPYNPFKACVVPRPIGWISSLDRNGVVNLAPYSYFNAVADVPPIVMFASAFKEDGSEKDTLKNIKETGEFVVNIATYELREKVNLTSTLLDHGVSEADRFDISLISSKIIKTPRVKDSPINLECQYLKTVELLVGKTRASAQVVFGHVVGVHIEDSVLVNGRVDIKKLSPIARLGYDEYAAIREIFKMKRP